MVMYVCEEGDMHRTQIVRHLVVVFGLVDCEYVFLCSNNIQYTFLCCVMIEHGCWFEHWLIDDFSVDVFVNCVWFYVLVVEEHEINFVMIKNLFLCDCFVLECFVEEVLEWFFIQILIMCLVQSVDDVCVCLYVRTFWVGCVSVCMLYCQVVPLFIRRRRAQYEDAIELINSC